MVAARPKTMDERRIHDKDKAFRTRDGTELHSIKDLYGHLSAMSDDEFSHHVNDTKNDFAAWIEHVHGDKFLAAAVRRSKTKDDLRKAVFIAMFR